VVKKNQSQHIAYSLDKGRTWKKFSGNPVLDLNEKDFRDPSVFWYERERKWVMAVVLSIQRKIQFYSSKDLKQWRLMSSFGPAGDTVGVWECPALFEAPVKGVPGESKWVLMHSPAPYMQYFVGEFDGTTFKNENPPAKIFRPDYGPDYYAAIVFNNLPPEQAPVSIAWLNNWEYAGEIPTTPWKGVLSMPRSLSVEEADGEWTLISEPLEALKTLRGPPLSMIPVSTKTTADLMQVKGPSEIMCELSVSENGIGGLKLSSKNQEEVTIGYNSATKEFFIDRSKSGNFSNPAYKKLNRFSTVVHYTNRRLPIRVFYDGSIISVFVNEGEACFTFQVFPLQDYDRLSLFAENGEAKLTRAKLWALKSIWKN
jgi:fructan beta-fructosidase